jgi:hypothetical protein
VGIGVEVGATTGGVSVGLLATGGAGAGFVVFLPPQATKQIQHSKTITVFFFIVSSRVFSLLNF